MKGGDGMVQKDIFTDMQAKIGCPYQMCIRDSHRSVHGKGELLLLEVKYLTGRKIQLAHNRIDGKVGHIAFLVLITQTHGRGRRGNNWVSQKGMALFSFQIGRAHV